jgi:hypothetical protein
MNKRDVPSTIEALMQALISAPNPSFESKRSSSIKLDQVLNAPRARHPWGLQGARCAEAA